MFSRFYETKHRWRRVAIFKPVRVTDVRAKSGGSRRQNVFWECHAGMHVLLRREPTIHDRNAVSLFANGERRIGALPAEIAEWVAPLLDSGKAIFDAEIWSLEDTEGAHDQHGPVCRLMLTQYERVTIKRLSLSAWWSGDGRSCPKPRLRERSGNLTWALSPGDYLSPTVADSRNRSSDVARHTNPADGQRAMSEGRAGADCLIALNRSASPQEVAQDLSRGC